MFSRQVNVLANDTGRTSRDWLRSAWASTLGWVAPLVALFAALLAPLTLRAVIWVVALLWMGTACLLNARGCGRTHCRYTGPYFLVMIAPVVLMGTRVMPFGFLAWLVLGVAILLGSGLLGWSTERALGKFS